MCVRAIFSWEFPDMKRHHRPFVSSFRNPISTHQKNFKMRTFFRIHQFMWMKKFNSSLEKWKKNHKNFINEDFIWIRKNYARRIFLIVIQNRNDQHNVKYRAFLVEFQLFRVQLTRIRGQRVTWQSWEKQERKKMIKIKHPQWIDNGGWNERCIHSERVDWQI